MADVHDFYRYYEVPGLEHCSGGPSGQPTTIFNQLRAWVENGTVPEQVPIDITDLQGNVQNRILCPYPERARFDEDCKDPGSAECWHCER